MTVAVRDAATVLLVRDATDAEGAPAVEVCMLRRNLASEFVAGAYVFPGGSVDDDDRGPAAEAVCRGLSDAEASKIVGVEGGGLALYIAALRECFEEAGVFVGVPAGADLDRAAADVLLDTRDPDVAARMAAHRTALNEGRSGIVEVCRSEGLELWVGGMFYVSHWITPELAPRRYDTRFFVTAAPSGQVARHDDGETIASVWVRPADALAQEQRGEIVLMPPTIANLRAILHCRTVDEVLTWAAQVTDVPTILPIVLAEDGNLVILRPGDEGYAEALADRLASGSSVDEGLAAVARDLWGPRSGTA